MKRGNHDPMLLAHSARCSAALLVVLLIAAAGCRQSSSRATPAESSSVRRYHLHGLVLGKSAVIGQVMVRQGAIPGFLPATNETYRVADSAVLARM
jgi:hypothetical protein